MERVAVHEESGAVRMTPEEIKKIKEGLECCASPVSMCAVCPYDYNCAQVKADALDLIEELEERIAIMTEGQDDD